MYIQLHSPDLFKRPESAHQLLLALYTYAYTYAYTYTNTYVNVYTYAYTYTNTYVNVYVYINIQSRPSQTARVCSSVTTSSI